MVSLDDGALEGQVPGVEIVTEHAAPAPGHGLGGRRSDPSRQFLRGHAQAVIRRLQRR